MSSVVLPTAPDASSRIATATAGDPSARTSLKAAAVALVVSSRSAGIRNGILNSFGSDVLPVGSAATTATASSATIVSPPGSGANTRLPVGITMRNVWTSLPSSWTADSATYTSNRIGLSPSFITSCENARSASR